MTSLALALVFSLPLANKEVSVELVKKNTKFQHTELNYTAGFVHPRWIVVWADLLLEFEDVYVTEQDKRSEYIVERPLSPGIHVFFEL